MGRNKKQESSGRSRESVRGKKSGGEYRLELDSKGRIVCFDEFGNRVPLGKCFAIGYGDDSNKVKVAIRKSCTFGEGLEKELRERLEDGTTVWRFNAEDEFEDESYMRKKRRTKA